ncbi:hypothetical protein AVEN_136176-1, partial [Araneus ventricosus]
MIAGYEAQHEHLETYLELRPSFLTILPVMTALKGFSKKKVVPIDERIECPGF